MYFFNMFLAAMFNNFFAAFEKLREHDRLQLLNT